MTLFLTGCVCGLVIGFAVGLVLCGMLMAGGRDDDEPMNKS